MLGSWRGSHCRMKGFLHPRFVLSGLFIFPSSYPFTLPLPLFFKRLKYQIFLLLGRIQLISDPCSILKGAHLYKGSSSQLDPYTFKAVEVIKIVNKWTNKGLFIWELWYIYIYISHLSTFQIIISNLSCIYYHYLQSILED